MARTYTKTFGSTTGVFYWLTVKGGKPIRCSSCRNGIQVGDRFLYRHGVPGSLSRQWLCLVCGAGIDYKVAGRAHSQAKHSRRSGEPRIAINAERVINLLAAEGMMTRRQIGMALSLGSSLDRHMKHLLRADLVSKYRFDAQRVEWFLTPKGKALADAKGSGFPALAAAVPEPQTAPEPEPEPEAPVVQPRRGVIRLSGKR